MAGPTPNVFTSKHPPVHGHRRKLGNVAAFTIDIPQGAIIDRIYVRNTTANAVTGGVKVGTTLTGTDVLAAGAVAASAVVAYVPLIGAINTAAVRTLFFDAVTAFNSASLDVMVEYTQAV